MNSNTQREFMYLFERVGEPLYFGPRGKDNVYYNVPMGGNMDSKTMDASVQVRSSGPRMKNSVEVSTPKEMPMKELEVVGTLCTKTELFSYFSEKHLDAAMRLKDLLMRQLTRADFMSMCAVTRDNAMVNPQLWIFAFASCALERQDMKGFKMPSFVEICPDMFITPAVSRLAQQQAILPEKDRKKIMITLDATGSGTNPENALAYFREDIGLNSHHYHWHVIFPTTAPKRTRDRKGELFYYMHSQMLRRYNTERLVNGLPVTKPFSLESTSVAEGYFPKLFNNNAGRVWGTRQTNTMLTNVERSDATARIQDLRTWRDRISEAIDMGFVVGESEERIPLTIDILGDAVEPSILSPNRRLYGNLHNLGHNLLAYAHDPLQLHQENMGVMGDTPTAMRDPIFYRWHTFIDDMFEKYKNSLGPYKAEELQWNAVQVSNISVKSAEGNAQPNVLYTAWMENDVDLGRGLDFGRRTATNTGAIWATFTTLNSLPFVYNISVTNTTNRPLTATVRIFLAPKHNEMGRKLDFRQQRKLFFEMDKFAHTLNPGKNNIHRQSKDSAVTVPFQQSFQQLELLSKRTEEHPPDTEAICGCGWPAHLLLPKSKTTGMTFDLYVIVSNGAEDLIPQKRVRTQGQTAGCKESVSYCGIFNEQYPDKRPMGYPWDRPINNSDNLGAFVKLIANSNFTEIRIVHRNEKVSRQGGAPVGMETIPDGRSRPSSPVPSLSPPRRPTSPRKPSSPESSRSRFSFGSYSPIRFNVGGRYDSRGGWRSPRDSSLEPEEQDRGWHQNNYK